MLVFNDSNFFSSVTYIICLPVIQVRRRVTSDEVDIKGLEAAVRGGGVESPRQEIARLRRQIEPEHYDLNIGIEVRSQTSL